MRPKLLEIEGLQSFTDVQRIDFEALGETGIFGIFGPTGSGKSTILDAITFALYGRVKRADGGTQGIIHSGRSTARVSFTFELGKSGKRRVYRVERTYQRKKNSANACEPKIARLIEVTETGEVPVCDRATEVSSHIRDLIGLNNEDFTRAVVLPQNSFQEFLLLNNSERRGMLERIFYLEEYGKQLQDKLGRRMARLKSRLDVMSGELTGYADASDEALDSAQKAMETATAERNRMEKELKQSEARFNEAKEVWTLLCELEDFNRREEELAVSAGQIAERKRQLDKAMKADSLLDMIFKTRELRNKLGDTQKQLDQVLADLPGISGGLEEMRARYENIRKEASSEQPKLVGRRTRLADALGIRKELDAVSVRVSGMENALKSLTSAMEEKNGLLRRETAGFEGLERELERLRAELESLKIDPAYRQRVQEGLRTENEAAVLHTSVTELEGKKLSLESSTGAIQKRLDEVREKVAASQKELDALSAEYQKHGESRPGDRNSILKGLERIHTVKGIYGLLQFRKEELDRMKAGLELQRAALSGLVQKAGTLEQKRSAAGEAAELCRLELEEAVREMERDAACVLARQLRNGQPCPVCGSEHHPAPAVQAGGMDMAGREKRAEIARKKLADAEQTFREAEREAVSAADRVKTLEEQNARAAGEIQSKAAEYEEEKQKLPEKLRSLELEQIGREVEDAGKAYGVKLETFDSWEAKQGEYREEIRRRSDVLAGFRLDENALLTEWTVNTGNMDQLGITLAETQKSLDAVNRQYAAFLQKYGIGSASGELKRLTENDHKSHVLQLEIEKLQQESGARNAVLDRLKEELRLTGTEQARLEAELSGLAGQRLEKEIKLKELVGDADIEGEIRRIDVRLEEYEKLEEGYKQELQLAEREYNGMATRKSLLENQQGIYLESLKKEELHLNSMLAEKGFGDAAEAEACVLSAEKQRELKAGIAEHEQAWSNIQAQKAMLAGKLKSRTITGEEWDRISGAHAELVSYKEECVSRSEVLKSNYDALKKKHDRWVELSREYAGLNRKQGLFEQIGRILKAEHRKDNSFIDYIAEERLRYIAAKASETVGVMTKYRYGLELDVEVGFIVRDNANGGAHRMVTSLSGGETFLTSLSLALALSEQIQLKGQSPLEFFFLDEGFGTLDADLLDTVIDSLERLSSRERVIGLISHVPELRSRIGRRLMVEPPAFRNQGSRVFIEKA